MITRRRASRALATVAAVGLAIALVAPVIAWSFIGQTERTAQRSLDLTTQAVSAVADTVEVAQTTLGSVSGALDTVAGSIGTVVTSFDATQSVLQGVSGFTGGQLPTAIETVSGALPTLADVGDAVDRALRTLSRAPLGINYDPTVPFGESVRQLNASLTKLPSQLRALAGTLDAATSSSGALKSDLTAIQTDLATTNRQLGDARSLLDRYASTARDARDLAVATRADVRVQARNGRLLAVLGGLGFAAMQAVPLLLAFVWWGEPGEREEREVPDDSATDVSRR